jgi:hypothetical protein
MKNTILNYVWINEKKADCPDGDNYGLPIPKHYLENAFAMAKAHPNISVIVWHDPNLMLDEEKLALKNFSPPTHNLIFRNLNEIEAGGFK